MSVSPARVRRANAGFLAAVLLCCALHGPVEAAAEYVPDTIVLDGTNTLRFASDPLLSLVNGGALEFWVAPDWTEDPGYGPVLLSNHAQQPVWEISLTGARDALGIQAADQYVTFDYDFTDGAMHHVAIVDTIDQLVVMIDGSVLGAAAMSFADDAGQDLWVGASNGNARPFRGALAAVRVWEGAQPLESLTEYALRDPYDPQAPHPSLDALLAQSDFGNGAFALVPVIEIDPNVLAAEE